MVPIVYLQVAQKENKTLAQQLAGIIHPAFICYAICRLVRLNLFFLCQFIIYVLGLFRLQTCQCSVGKRTSQFLWNSKVYSQSRGKWCSTITLYALIYIFVCYSSSLQIRKICEPSWTSVKRSIPVCGAEMFWVCKKFEQQQKMINNSKLQFTFNSMLILVYLFLEKMNVKHYYWKKNLRTFKNVRQLRRTRFLKFWKS